MNIMRSRQRGVGLYGWIFLVAVLGLAGTLIIRLAPHYLNDRTLGAQLDGVMENEDVRQMSRRQIREALQKRMRVNSLTMDLKDILTIDRDGAITTIVIEYEVREPIVSNVDVVLSFRHEGVHGG